VPHAAPSLLIRVVVGALALFLWFYHSAEASPHRASPRQTSSSSHQALAPQVLAARSMSTALEIAGAQYFPLLWSDLKGWKEDDQLAAYNAFRISCRAITSQAGRPVGAALGLPCRLARGL